MIINWIDGFKISVWRDGDSVVISANREGLLSLAKQMIDLAQEGGHLHYDQWNSLEEGSEDLIIERTAE